MSTAHLARLAGCVRACRARRLQRADHSPSTFTNGYRPTTGGISSDARAHREAFAATPDYLSCTAAGRHHVRPISPITDRADATLPRLEICLRSAHGRAPSRSRSGATSARPRSGEPYRTASGTGAAAPVTLNVVCFRYRPPMRLTRDRPVEPDVLTRLQTGGWPSCRTHDQRPVCDPWRSLTTAANSATSSYWSMPSPGSARN